MVNKKVQYEPGLGSGKTTGMADSAGSLDALTQLAGKAEGDAGSKKGKWTWNFFLDDCIAKRVKSSRDGRDRSGESQRAWRARAEKVRSRQVTIARGNGATSSGRQSIGGVETKSAGRIRDIAVKEVWRTRSNFYFVIVGCRRRQG